MWIINFLALGFACSAALWALPAYAWLGSFGLSLRVRALSASLLGTFLFLYFGSFLVGTGRVGLPLMLAAGLGFAWRYRRFLPEFFRSFDLTFLDFFVCLLPIAMILVSPMLIDTQLTPMQDLVLRDRWPLDISKRLDVFFGFPILVHHWLGWVPLGNLMAALAPSFMLLSWKTVSVIVQEEQPGTDRKAVLFAVLLFCGSLYFRKQFHGKWSPWGAVYALYSLWLLDRIRHHASAPWILAVLWTGALAIGNYGALLVAPTLFWIFISDAKVRGLILRAGAYTCFLSTPEIFRNAWMFSGQNIQASLAAVGAVVSAGLVLRYFAGHKIPSLTLPIQTLFYLATIGAVIASLIWPVPGPFNEELSLNFWQWTVGKEGILYFALLFWAFWQLRKTQNSFAHRVLALLVTLHLTFILWRMLNQFPELMNRIDPNQLWWNQWKNSMMITMPLLTTLAGALTLATIWPKHRALGAVLVAFFALLQDPLVKQVGHGPFAPHAPRLSASQSIDAMVWHLRHKPGVTSADGRLHLNYLALPEPRWTQRIFAAEHERTQTACMDSNLAQKSSDLAFSGMQALSFMTGAQWKVVSPKQASGECDFFWVSEASICPPEFYLEDPSAHGHLCLKH